MVNKWLTPGWHTILSFNLLDRKKLLKALWEKEFIQNCFLTFRETNCVL